jgi:hypothetical protein
MRFRVFCGQSGSDVVLVGESAEDLLAADPELGEVDRFRRAGAGLSWCELAEGAVRPNVVVVQQVIGPPGPRCGATQGRLTSAE